MKRQRPVFRFPLLASALLVLAVPVLPAEEVKLANGQVMRDVATDEELSNRLAQAKDPVHELKQLEEKEAAKPAKPAKVASLFDTSDFLCFNGQATLVPKGAVLHVPKSMQDRLHFAEGSSIQTWADFLPLNRAWITTVEVSRVQAEGNALISEETLKSVAKSPMVVIATLQGGPISVLPPKVPVVPAPGSNQAASSASSTTSAIK
jgi:Tfp pilus assembly protein PilN